MNKNNRLKKECKNVDKATFTLNVAFTTKRCRKIRQTAVKKTKCLEIQVLG
jgi:hypothetical protein